MTFKDLHYSLGKFKTDVRSQLARKNPLQKPDTKALSMWIFEERNDLKAMRVSAYHRDETTKSFLDWIVEHEDEDLQDIGGKLAQIIEMQTEVERDYIGKYQKYRRIIKTIRERDDTIVSSVREKKRAVEARLNHLYKSNRKSRKIPQFEQELVQLSTELEQKEIEMADYKRLALREAFYVRFNALHEYAEKSSLVAGFGNYLVDLLDIEPQSCQKPYTKFQETDMIWMDCKLAVEGWQPDDKDERPTVLEDLLVVEDNDGSSLLGDDAEMLTDDDVVSPPPSHLHSLATSSSQNEQQQQQKQQQQGQERSSQQIQLEKEEEKEKLNEKWTYVASLDNQDNKRNPDQLGHFADNDEQDPPPAYTPPADNLDLPRIEKENNSGSSSSSSSGGGGKQLFNLSHKDPQQQEEQSVMKTPPPPTASATSPATLSTTTTPITTIGQNFSSSNHDSDINSNSSDSKNIYHASDYRDLYDQITQRERNTKQPRPYVEFQQRLHKSQQQQQQQTTS